MKNESSFKQLMVYAGKYKLLTYLSWILSAVSAFLGLLPFVYIWFIINELLKIYPNFSGAEDVIKNGVTAVAFSAAAMLIYFAGLMCSHIAAFRIAANIRKAAVRHICSLPIGAFNTIGSGKIRSIINESSGATETYLAHQLPDMAGAIVTPIGIIVMLMFFDWRIGIVCLIPVILGFCAMYKMAGPAMAEDMKSYKNCLEDMNNEAVEYVRGIPVVKTFGQTVFSFKRFKQAIDNYLKFAVSYTKKCRTPMLAFTVLINSTFVFIIAMGLLLSKNGITAKLVTNIIFYIIFTPIISTNLTKVMFMSENVMTVKDALSRINGILSLKPLAEPPLPKRPKDNSVEFKNVVFRYENADTNALDNISLKIQPKQTIAFVGPSGGGKTTAAGLISRFWDTTEGSIKIGGVNVKDISKERLSDIISYVFQDSRLLKNSILENVRLSKPNASRKEVIEALYNAQCADIISKLPKGIDTVIGTKGVYLSGGEQQRIAVARLMLKNSPIIILDEATAFADPENEYLIQRAFETLAENKTVIIIAHRLTTVKNADRIYVLDEGKIVENGSHKELLTAGGIYGKMWRDYMTSVNWKVGV